MSEVVSSIKHPTITAARRALRPLADAQPRAFLAEGASMVAQALAAGVPIEAVFFLHPVLPASPEAELLARVQEVGVEHHLLTKGVFARLLDLRYETAARVLATVTASSADLRHVLATIDCSFCALVAENIQDPRNVGLLVRAADAWRVRLLVLTADSADPFSRSSVRATTGSIFRVPVLRAHDLPETLRALGAHGARVIGSSAQAARPSWEADLSRPAAIVVGNETNGLSAATRAACDLMVAIPMSGGAHSLNVAVAAGVMLYEMERQNAHVSSRG